MKNELETNLLMFYFLKSLLKKCKPKLTNEIILIS